MQMCIVWKCRLPWCCTTSLASNAQGMSRKSQWRKYVVFMVDYWNWGGGGGKEEFSFCACVCVKQVFLLADHFSLPLFWGSGLLGHSEAPCHLACFSWGCSAAWSIKPQVRTEKHFKLMALLQWIPFQKTEQQQAYRSQFLYTLPYPLWLLWRLNNFRVEKVWVAFALSILVQCFFNELPHFQLTTSSI